MKKLKLLILSLMLMGSGISERSYAAFIPKKATTTLEQSKKEEPASTESTPIVTEENKDAVKVTPEKYEMPEKKEFKGGKSYYVALALVVLLGAIGAHRYYLGKPISGIGMIFTLGGFGVWWLYDIFRVATGKMKPAFGNYKGSKGEDKSFKTRKK